VYFTAIEPVENMSPAHKEITAAQVFVDISLPYQSFSRILRHGKKAKVGNVTYGPEIPGAPCLAWQMSPTRLPTGRPLTNSTSRLSPSPV